MGGMCSLLVELSGGACCGGSGGGYSGTASGRGMGGSAPKWSGGGSSGGGHWWTTVGRGRRNRVQGRRGRRAPGHVSAVVKVVGVGHGEGSVVGGGRRRWCD